MADIQSFSALRYDPRQVSLAQVVTQPYDKITPAMQERYYAASPHNLVRIILGRREKTDNAENNVYSRAAAYFGDWRKRGILRQDPIGQEMMDPFRERVLRNRGRLRKTTIVALARKLLVALWKYVTTGVVIEGATMKAH